MVEFKPIIPKRDSIKKQAWESIKKQIEEKYNAQLRMIKCPDHNQSPKLIVSGSLGKLKYSIEGCCQKLTDMAENAWN